MAFNLFQLSFHSLYSLDPKHHEFLKRNEMRITPETFYSLCKYVQNILIEKCPNYANAYFEALFRPNDNGMYPKNGKITVWHAGYQYYDGSGRSVGWVNLTEEDFLCKDTTRAL